MQRAYLFNTKSDGVRVFKQNTSSVGKRFIYYDKETYVKAVGTPSLQEYKTERSFSYLI